MTGDRHPWTAFDHLRIADAAARLAGVVERTPLVPFRIDDERIELRLKLENRQVVGAFKARGAWNHVSQLTPAEREAGVVCISSGNHGKAVAWAAQRAGVHATVVMPSDAYPNKIAACRELGAEVVLSASRSAAEADCRAIVASGRVLVHPYDSERTVQGAGTVGLEIAQDWPAVEAVFVQVGGGGLVSGVSLALRQTLGGSVRIFGAEPAGAATLGAGLRAGKPVRLESTSSLQGLTPPYSGQINIDICRACLDGIFVVEDDAVLDAQKVLVRADETVEPAGAASLSAVLGGLVPSDLLRGRDARHPLRVAAIVSGGNPDPEQIERLRRDLARED